LPLFLLFWVIRAVFWAAIAVHLAAVFAVLGHLGGILGGCSRSFYRPLIQVKSNTVTDKAVAISTASSLKKITQISGIAVFSLE